jgi:hypothetical protein
MRVSIGPRTGIAFVGALLAVLLAGSGICRADGFLAPPKTHQVCSPSGKFCAIADAEKGATTVYEVAPDGTRKELWGLPRWERMMDVSDRGALVIGYDGLNLVPKNYDPELTLLAFHVQGRIVKRVTLRELFVDLGTMVPAVSHRDWGRYVGWDAAGNYQVETTEGRVLSFDPETGARVGVRWLAGHEPPGRWSAGRMALYAGLVALLVIFGVRWLRRRG